MDLVRRPGACAHCTVSYASTRSLLGNAVALLSSEDPFGSELTPHQWILAGVTAIEAMGGPVIPFKPGRTDFADDSKCPPRGRLPDASQAADHIRAVFGRMGFNDQEMVALSGAHNLGRCHSDRSGFHGPWVPNGTRFSNTYFRLLMNNEWQPKKWDGNFQYANHGACFGPAGARLIAQTLTRSS